MLPPTFSRLPRWVALSLLVTLAGCDSLPFLGDDDKDKDKESNADADADADKAKREAEIEAAKKAAVDEFKKKNEADVEKRIADEAQKAVEAEKKREADEAAAKAAAEELEKRPLKLSELSVTSSSSPYGPKTGMVEVKAKAKLKEAVGSSTYVHVKASCEAEGRVFADIGYMNSHYSKPLEQYTAGEEAEITGNLFTQGYTDVMFPCKLEFKLAGMGAGGLSVDLGEGCWDGNEAKMEPCAKPVVAVAASGASKPFEVLSVQPQAVSYGSGLNLDFKMLLNDKYNPMDRITVKATCLKDTRAFVNVAQAYMTSGPFDIEAGESIARNASLFWSDIYGFGGSPKLCDVTIARWFSPSGSYGDYEEQVLKNTCLRDTTFSEGRCDGGSAPTPSRGTPMTTTNSVLDEVQINLTEPYGATGKFQAEVFADVTVSEVVTSDQGVQAEVTCKVGKEKRVETIYLYGTDLYYLSPGETARINSTAFSSAAMDEPQWCQVQFQGGARYAYGGTSLDLGTFCSKKGKIKSGKC